MCGIISAKNLKDSHPVNELVKIYYQNQKGRGQQGFGFIGLSKERIDTYRATNERGIMKYLNQYQYDEIIFHHRMPTSTQNTLKGTHPFITEMAGKRYYFMHNGHIQNAEELKQRHSKRGIAYSSIGKDGFNDSEALAWDFCLWLNNQQAKVEAEGSVAFACLEVSKETSRAERLYFYRNSGAQLRIYRDKTLFLLASEGSYPLIRENRLYFWDYQEGQIKRSKALNVQMSSHLSSDRYGCSYFVEKPEIGDVIAALEQERDYLLSVGKYSEAEVTEEEIEDLRDRLRESQEREPGKGANRFTHTP